MSVSDLRITEVMYNPAPGGIEFIEITNTGPTSVFSEEFFVGNSDFIPEFYGNGPVPFGVEIPAGGSVIIVPFPFFIDASSPTQADFEAVYGPLPAGTVFIAAPTFSETDGTGDILPGDQTYTIGGIDIFADSIFIPGTAATGESAQISLGDGSLTFAAPTPGTTGTVAPVVPTNGDDTLVGTAGDDVIDGLAGRDTIDGGAGDDDLTGGDGNDAIDGGQDNDTIDLGQGNDNAWGGEGDDVLFGGSGLDRLNGNSGDDEIYGGKGGDIIQGGKGEDYIDGGRQSDSISGGEQADEIYGGTGNDTINGDEGADVIYGGSGGDIINGGTFNDLIFGDHGADIINGGSDDDTIYGGKSNDKLNGNTGNDTLYGDSGNDKLTGGSGDDILDGGSQADRLNGGTGNDTLFGSLGNDELTGGADADTFVFAGVTNDDIITDFEVGIDKIDFTAYGPISDLDAASIATQVGADVVLDLGQNGQVTLQGVALGELSLDDFIYLPEDIFVVG